MEHKVTHRVGRIAGLETSEYCKAETVVGLQTLGDQLKYMKCLLPKRREERYLECFSPLFLTPLHIVL
jgi:hypothetical protein